MSKRPCPFEDNNAPQSKVHVSDADVNSQNEEYMQQLQQQTIRRLFEASNRPSTSANQPSDGVQPSTSGGSSSEQQQKEPSDTEMETDSPRVEPCLLCAQIAVGMCWFCEAKLCGDCTRTCIYCMEQFCTRCSIGVYKEAIANEDDNDYTNGTTHTCLTCYN